jgi:hypothetical protein
VARDPARRKPCAMSQPSTENGDSEDRESVWERAARELSSNPDSPSSLTVMAAVNSALRPQQPANEQLVEAVAMRQDDPASRRRRRGWSKVDLAICGGINNYCHTGQG